MGTKKSNKKFVSKYLLSPLLDSISYIGLLLICLSTLEAVLIYPPIHSYSIGPPFFWILASSPFLFIFAFLVGAPISRAVAKRLSTGLKSFFLGTISALSLISALVIALAFIDLYRGKDFIGFSNPHIRSILSIVQPFAMFSPAITNYFFFKKLQSFTRITKLMYAIMLCVLAVVSVEVWWYLTGHWLIGYY